MSGDRGFTVQDRRKVKAEDSSAEEKEEQRAAADATDAGRRTAIPLPPVDFAGFILGLGQMALAYLGEIPVPGTDEIAVDLDQARHSIDILDMLEAKTRGNLTADEEHLLRTLEEELKLTYVRVTQQRPG
jgi:hypothetical protein